MYHTTRGNHNHFSPFEQSYHRSFNNVSAFSNSSSLDLPHLLHRMHSPHGSILQKELALSFIYNYILVQTNSQWSSLLDLLWSHLRILNIWKSLLLHHLDTNLITNYKINILRRPRIYLKKSHSSLFFLDNCRIFIFQGILRHYEWYRLLYYSRLSAFPQ